MTTNAISFVLTLIAFAAFHILSPVADLVLSAGKVLYAALLMGLATLLFAWSGDEFGPRLRLTYARAVRWVLVALAVTLLMHSVVHPASLAPNARYLLLIGIGLGLFYRVHPRHLAKLFERMTCFFALYGVYVLVVYGLVWAGHVDPEYWAARKLEWLPVGNPMAILSDTGTQSYLLFYSVGITRADDVLDFGFFSLTRLTGFFVEPTDVAYVLGFLLLLGIGRIQRDRRIGILMLTPLALMFVCAFAASGFAALAMSLCLRLAFMQWPQRYRFLRGAMIVSIGILVVGIVLAPETIVGLFGAQKLIQFQYFKSEMAGALDMYLGGAPFGSGINADFGHRTYGIFAVLAQHGWLPFLVFACYLGLLVVASIKLLRTDQWPVGAAGVFLAIVSLKYSEIVNLFLLICSMYVMKTWMCYQKDEAGNVDDKARRMAPLGVSPAFLNLEMENPRT
ncbi:MAG TPA: hypothetical protein VM532_09640 [Burkholderiales bacterium]|jgi:hypothetical protein|nr:hypothetical protein [Burkholderiales bacterium]